MIQNLDKNALLSTNHNQIYLNLDKFIAIINIKILLFWFINIINFIINIINIIKFETNFITIKKNIDVIWRIKSIIIIIIVNLGLEGHARPKLLGSNSGQTQVPWVLQPYLTQDNWVKSQTLG